jgi:endonuclease YncB( thermonuclease family)
MTKLYLFLCATVLVLGFPALAQDDKLCGRATAKDGDDLLIAGQDIRLHGVDAFELGQRCTSSNGQTWACGQAARRKLNQLVAGSEVCCERMQTAKADDRVVMRCVVRDVDVGQEMVRAGLALDCPRFSQGRYQGDEAAAQAAHKGAWEGGFDAPWVHKGTSYCCAPGFPREWC